MIKKMYFNLRKKKMILRKSQPILLSFMMWSHWVQDVAFPILSYPIHFIISLAGDDVTAHSCNDWQWYKLIIL